MWWSASASVAGNDPVEYNELSITKSLVFTLIGQVMLDIFTSRLPGKQNTITLFATAVFIVYGWTIIASFWKIPSWVFYLELGEIVSVYAYSFIVNFAESFLLTLSLVLLGIFLYGNLWRDGFLSGSVMMLVVFVGSMLLHMRMHADPNLRFDFITSQLRWWAVTLLIGFVASFISVRVPWLRRTLENLADRFVVFLYIYLPLTALFAGVILVRILL
jgi:hypothetical protein